jgi:hypothetical protein
MKPAETFASTFAVIRPSESYAIHRTTGDAVPPTLARAIVWSSPVTR